MIGRALREPLQIPPRIRRVLLASYIGLLGFIPAAFPWNADLSPDWMLWRALPEAIAAGDVYGVHAPTGPFVWSPFAAVAMQFAWPLYWSWLIAHFAVLPLLRDWRMVAFVLLSFGFWTSTWSGSPFIFIFVAAVLAYRGSRPAALVYVGLTLLIPRPLQLPLVAWVLWRMPEIRWPAALLLVVHTGLVVASGYALDWFSVVGAHAVTEGNYGLTRFFGPGLLLIGIPLGAWLLWRGRPGLSGLAISPYWLPEYFMFALLDLCPSPGRHVVHRRTRSRKRQISATGFHCGQCERARRSDVSCRSSPGEKLTAADANVRPVTLVPS